MFLGETEFVTRKYFEESVYRNILDLLNTLEDVAIRVGKDIANTAINTIGLKNKWYLYMIKEKRGVIGAAINAIGKSVGENGIDTYYWWARKIAMQNKIPYNTTSNPLGANGNQVYDLLQIGRTIETEMNRVRIPVPENFRQFLDKITKLTLTATMGGKVPMASGNIIGTNEVHLIEGLKAIRQLLDSITVLRGEIRIIIDKANLEVQEETLRRESEQLKNNEQLAAQIEAEKKRIEQEKIDYQNRIAELAAVKIAELSQSNNAEHAAMLEADIKQLDLQKIASETVAVKQQQNLIQHAAVTGIIPVQVPVDAAIETKFKRPGIIPIAAGLLTVYSMFN